MAEELTLSERLAEARQRQFEAELALAKQEIRAPFVDALVRAAEAEAETTYLRNRLGELESQLGRRASIRDASSRGVARFLGGKRGELQKIVDATLRDPQAMQELHTEQFERRQRAKAEEIEERRTP